MGILTPKDKKRMDVKRTDKGNVLYEFKRVTSEELAAYRVKTYGYIL